MGEYPLLVATDLDGTIIRGDGTISARTVAAFARVETAGARFVLVTGRPPRWMASIAATFGHRGTAICANGALAYDMRTGAIEARHLIAPPALAAAAAALRARPCLASGSRSSTRTGTPPTRSTRRSTGT